MPKKAIVQPRTAIIGAVQTPLGFFTLGVLVVEAILATISVRATGFDFTLLVVGMLIGFIVLCGMVFAIVVHPRASAILGLQASHTLPPYEAVMELSNTDIRVLREITFLSSDYVEAGEVLRLANALQAQTTPLQRLDRLERGHFITYFRKDRDPLQSKIAPTRTTRNLFRVFDKMDRAQGAK